MTTEKTQTLRWTDQCADCPHTESQHEETLLGCICHGKDWEQPGLSPPCQCKGYRPRSQASDTPRN